MGETVTRDDSYDFYKDLESASQTLQPQRFETML